MSIRFDKRKAEQIVRAAAAVDHVDTDWLQRVEKLSELCKAGGAMTHIAFVGTAMIAKALRVDVDLFAIKPKHAPRNPKAYSARSLCHTVLVPLAADLGFSLGVTGREPLNNQPYFRIRKVGDETPIRERGREAFNFMERLVMELQVLRTTKDAQAALAAYIAARRGHQARYAPPPGEIAISAEELCQAVRALVRDDSEGGRRAQAVVAGLMDALAGPDRVESDRINDPGRTHPGDVRVRSAAEPGAWEKAFEIRDKPVSNSDVQIFGKKCLDMGTREAAVVAVGEGQRPLDHAKLSEWARDLGVGVTLFESWGNIVEQALFWASDPKPDAARQAARFIHERLIALEASPAAVELWVRLTGRDSATTPKGKKSRREEDRFQ